MIYVFKFAFHLLKKKKKDSKPKWEGNFYCQIFCLKIEIAYRKCCKKSSDLFFFLIEVKFYYSTNICCYLTVIIASVRLS